jgi:hypothetical protein
VVVHAAKSIARTRTPLLPRTIDQTLAAGAVLLTGIKEPGRVAGLPLELGA